MNDDEPTNWRRATDRRPQRQVILVPQDDHDAASVYWRNFVAAVQDALVQHRIEATVLVTAPPPRS